MQFQVPQFIETEDKIVGPLSFKQFIYIGAAVGLSLLLFFTVRFWLWVTLSLPLILLGVSLALIKVNGQDMARVLVSAASFYWRPRLYVWHSENPRMVKSESSLKSLFGSTGDSLERILSGIALKQAREGVETGTKTLRNKLTFADLKEKYEIVERLAGDRRAMKRVDYR